MLVKINLNVQVKCKFLVAVLGLFIGDLNISCRLHKVIKALRKQIRVIAIYHGLLRGLIAWMLESRRCEQCGGKEISVVF